MTNAIPQNNIQEKQEKSFKVLFWENLQLLVLGLTIAGQIIVGGSYIIGQVIWLAANIIMLARGFILRRPAADKIKDAALTAITAGLCGAWLLEIF